MIRRLVFVSVAAALLLFRLPSLAQPMGADQALYAYVGERILDGGLPYRDAWDQKPPAIHYSYAVLRAVWPHDSAVAAADLVLAAATALAIHLVGQAVAPAGSGAAAALIFLLLSNPAFTRLGGVRLRAQCETFIALAITGAVLLVIRRRSGSAAMIASGALLGIAVAYKYNAIVYGVVVLVALLTVKRLSPGNLARLAIGFCAPIAIIVVVFAAGGALRALFDATVTYNLRYSGQTYSGLVDALAYLIRFPVERARVDALWTLGGAGCAVLIFARRADRTRLLAPVWVVAACVSIAINGSRGLPQYFVQAGPALALAAGWAGTVAWAGGRSTIGHRATRNAAIVLAVGIAVAVWRVNQFPKLVEQTWFDARRAFGNVGTDEYRGRYSDDRKYSPLAMSRLAEYMRAHSRAEDRVYVFGFSSAAYLDCGRVSASRFFWSRPVIAGFNEGIPGYGVAGLAAELQASRPAVVALQRQDWAPDVDDSAHFFMTTPALAGWLEAEYVHADGPDQYDVWVRWGVAP
jgi:4-amino-4-deoxy-L-arabinose transferase-like glycosyltransferase